MVGGGGMNEVVKCKIFFVYNSLYWIKCCVVTLLRPPLMRFQLEHVELSTYLFLKLCSVYFHKVIFSIQHYLELFASCFNLK